MFFIALILIINFKNVTQQVKDDLVTFEKIEIFMIKYFLNLKNKKKRVKFALMVVVVYWVGHILVVQVHMLVLLLHVHNGAIDPAL